VATTVNTVKLPGLFRSMLNKEVTAAKLPPFIIPPNEPCITANYETDQGVIVAVCVCDLALVANAGAALVLLPPSAAKDSVTSKKLDPSLAENFLEILNVCNSLFSTPEAQRIKLGKVCTIQKERTEETTKFIASAGTKYATKLTVAGYGDGRMCIFS